MVKHRLTTTVVALCAVAALLTGSLILIQVHAQRVQAAAPATVFVVQKVVLNETSVDAPGLFSSSGTFEGQPFHNSVIAWAGTDAAHHLNVMTSTDGLHYGHKITLLDRSMFRPDVVQMSPAAGGAVLLAWTGTDPAHHLNVMFDVYGSRQKLILAERSFTTPALTDGCGGFCLAWTGTDANHSLIIMPILIAPLRAGSKTVLSQFSSNAGPNLSHIVTTQSNTLVLCWSTRTSHLNLADSTDGIHFTSALGGGLPQTSAAAPDFLFFPSEGQPQYWIAWTGTDPDHHLNMQWTTHYPQWPDPAHTKTVLSDRALGGPALEFFPAAGGRLVAWTGTDSAHHLNVATVDGF
jgi:hypothetical protein